MEQCAKATPHKDHPMRVEQGDTIFCEGVTDHTEDRERWYTVTVMGHPVDGNTDDLAEARMMLARVNHEEAFDGGASITITEEPIAW